MVQLSKLDQMFSIERQLKNLFSFVLAFYALNGLRIFVAVVQGIVAITASAMACGPLCCDETQVCVDNNVPDKNNKRPRILNRFQTL